MNLHESKVKKSKTSNSNSNNNNNSSSPYKSNNNNNNNNNFRNSNKNLSSGGGGGGSSNGGAGKNSILVKSEQEDNVNSASVMSAYALDIDADHIDDQETVNVGNLIIDLENDLECDLEKEKIVNEQANAKSTSYSTSNAPSSSSSSSTYTPIFGVKASPSTTTLGNSSNTPIGKLNQKSTNKHSNVIINNATTSSSSSSNNNNNSNINISNNSTVNCSSIGISNNSYVSNSNNGHLMTTRTVFKSSSDERGELKMRITRETKPGKNEHKIVTSPNQKSPTSSSNSVNPINSMSSGNLVGHSVNDCEDIGLNDSISKPSQSSSISSTKECGTSTSIGTITEPDCLGPCEPGTSVTLEGIVWQETEGGILVVNVTWRGKTYVGALLDCTKHDWAPPRLCDSPASDIDSKAHKGVRTKRVVTRSNGIGLDEKNLLQTTGKLRNGKGRRILSTAEVASCNKRQRESDKSNENIAAQTEANTSLANVSSITNSETISVPMNIDTAPATNNESISTSNISTEKAGPNSPMLIGCSEPNCSKKFRNVNGLLYHQTHAHSSENEPNNAQDNNCSSSVSEKVNLTDHQTSKEQVEQKDIEPTTDNSDRQSQNPPEQPQQQPQQLQHDRSQEMKLYSERRQTPSPQLSMKMSNKINSDPSTNNTNVVGRNQGSRSSVVRNLDTSFNQIQNNSQMGDHSRRSPGISSRPIQDHGHHGLSNHHSSSKSSSSSTAKQQSNPLPLPVTTEEGMKPSGTSTGPPPAPHQGNCYFTGFPFNPYGIGGPYYPRSPLPMFDPLAPVTSSANAAMLTRFMNTMRVPPPPESPSRLLSPSMGKNLPFPPGPMHAPTSQMTHPLLPNMPPLTNPPLASGSPHLRMPSQGDPMMQPTSQPPFPHPIGLNPVMGLPGSTNPMGPMGGPQVPSLVDDPLAKQFPRRFN